MKKIAIILALLTLFGSFSLGALAADPISSLDDENVIFFEDFEADDALQSDSVEAGNEVSISADGYLDMHSTGIWSNNESAYKRELSAYKLSSGKFSIEYRFQIVNVGNPNPDEPIGVPSFALSLDSLGRVIINMTQNAEGNLVLRVEENADDGNAWIDYDTYAFDVGVWYTFVVNFNSLAGTFSVMAKNDDEAEFTTIVEDKHLAIYYVFAGNMISICTQFSENAQAYADYLLLRKGYFGDEADETSEELTTDNQTTEAPTTEDQTTTAPTTDGQTTDTLTTGSNDFTTGVDTMDDNASDGDKAGIQPWIFIAAATVVVIIVIVVLVAKKKK